MKVAIILYGQTRNLHISVKSWIFHQVWDCDYYVSTWSITKQFSDRMPGIQYIKKIDEEYIKKCIHNSNIQIYDEESEIRNVDYLNTNANKSLFHIKKAFNAIKNSNVKYDFIILTRSDQYFTFGKDSKHDISQYKYTKTIFGMGKMFKQNGENHINDIFFIGPYQIMEYLIENLDYRPNNGLHTYFANKFIELGIDFHPDILGISNVTVRPNALELKDYEINFDSLNEKSIRW